jgi:hypothetical protein
MIQARRNPSYLGGWDQEDMVQAQPGQKKFEGPHVNGKELGIVVCACHSSDSTKI